MSAILESSKFLKTLREQTDTVVVAYSGGKDSLCTLDLAVRHFPKVIPVHYYFVPDLECIQKSMDWPLERYGLHVKQYPGPSFFNSQIGELYCDLPHAFSGMKAITHTVMYEYLKLELDCKYVLTGARKDESFSRRKLIEQGKFPGIQPIADWRGYHVEAYMKANRIPRPNFEVSKNASGVSADPETINYIHQKWPADIDRIEKYFPYIRALIYREIFYGNEKS